MHRPLLTDLWELRFWIVPHILTITECPVITVSLEVVVLVRIPQWNCRHLWLWMTVAIFRWEDSGTWCLPDLSVLWIQDFTLHDFNCNSRTLHTALVVAIQEFKVSCFVYWNMENLLDLFVFILKVHSHGFKIWVSFCKLYPLGCWFDRWASWVVSNFGKWRTWKACILQL